MCLSYVLFRTGEWKRALDMARGVVRDPDTHPGLKSGATGVLGTAQVPDGIATASTDVLERLRIEAGVPAMGPELTDRTIPAEAGVVERSVSFTKGCFTGQELVARIDSRGGNVPRHLRRLEAEGPDALPVGGDVVVAGQVVGEVTSSVPAGNGRPAVALAYVGRAVEPPASGAVADRPVRILEATTR